MYLVGPVAPFKPAQNEVDEFAFAEDLRRMAPNENLVWMRGQYVEADNPNANGALWTSQELAIKHLTPMFMPVTVMHDPRTAVGLIADTKLLTPEADAIERSRIDTTLGLWGHRFPEVVEESLANYRQGSLMQSMEMRKISYSCGSCGKEFFPLPDGAEESNWCAHLRGETAAENAAPVRRLSGTFTGTGLIFGTRGAKGAYNEAHLEVLADEVAEFHERAHRHEPRRPRRPKATMDISDSDYQELVAAKTERDALKARVPALEETAAKVPALETQVTTLETEKVAVEKERDTLKGEKEALEENARKDELATTRKSKFGKEFLAKFGELTRGQIDEKAKTLSDDDWAKEVKALEELTGVKHDAGGAPDPADAETHTREETARANLGGGGGNTSEPSTAQRGSVVGGLVKTLVKS